VKQSVKGLRDPAPSPIAFAMGWLKRIFPDRFIWVLFGAIAVANIWPARGANAELANLVSSGAVFLIFLLHGIRLPRQEVIDGLANWRLQGAIAGFVFVGMGLTGLALARILDNWLPPVIALGFLYCGVLPSTVQSATTYCSLAKGNVAASVVAAAMINLAAIVVTPLLFTLLAGRAGGVTLSGDLAVRIALILLLPFIIGQLLQRWVRPWALRHPGLIKMMDQGAIAIAVYVAFSAAVVGGHLVVLSGHDFALVGAAVGLMLAIGFGGSWVLGRLMRLNRSDRTTMLFAGAHKSIAVGAPLATLLFPAEIAGMILLPILLYHLAQLVLSAWIAAPLAARAESA
jgi:solute carrier family 10 (sodium/bile acid cotransporter), member 7